MERLFAKFGKGKILPFIELGRPWNGLIVVVLSILGAFWSKSQLDYLSMGILALVVFLIYNGSASLNDIYDDKIDAINMPYRPLQRGAFSLKSATIFCVTSYLSGNLIALFVSPQFLIAIVAMSAISILYSSPPFSFKNRCFIGNLTLAFVSVVTTIYAGYVFATGSLFMPYPLFAGANFLMILFAFFSLLKDFKDFYGDRAYGKNTLVALYGIKNASKVNIIGTSIFFPAVTIIIYDLFVNEILFIFSSILLFTLLFVIEIIVYILPSKKSGEASWSIGRVIILLFILTLFMG